MNYKYIVIYSFLAWVLLFSNSKKLFSQTFIFENYTVNDGLPSSEVYHTIQDSKGYIWFATNQGVSRFNGYEFENFSMKDGLPDNTVFDLFEDNKGRIWFVPLTSKLSYYYNDSIYQFNYNDSIILNHGKGFDPPMKNSFYIDSNDNIYISFLGTTKPIKIAPDGKTELMLEEHQSGHGFIKIENHCLFYHSYRNTFNYNDEKELIGLRFNYPPTYSFGYNDSDDRILYTNKVFLNIIEENGNVKTIISPTQINWISEDSDKTYWIGTKNGLFLSKQLDKEIFTNAHLSNETITSVNEDNEGIIWITTTTNGVYTIKNKNIKIFTESDGLINTNTKKLSFLDNTILVSYSNRGLSAFNTNDHEKIKTVNKNITEIFSFDTDPVSQTFYFSNFDGIHISSKPYKTTSTILTHIKNCKALLTHNDSFWYCTKNGLFLLTQNKQKLHVRFNRPYDLVRIDSILYLGTLEGLWKYNINKRLKTEIKSSLLPCRINDIEELSKNILLLGTKGNGLLYYDIHADTTFKFDINDGLCSNSITKISVSKSNTVWIATNNGISKINFTSDKYPKIKNIQNISDYNGLPSKEINDILLYDKFLYLTTNIGLVKIDVSKIEKNPIPPPIYFENIKLGQDLLPKRSKYTFKHQADLISIEYTGLSYINTGALHYQYRMLGIDTTWTDTKERLIQYAKLTPNNYTFEVRGQNEDGVWSIEPARIEFIVTPPFYQRIWFILLCILATTFTIITIVKYREREIKKKNLLLLTINNYKQQILRQQMNPHFMFNTLNSIQYYLLEEDIDSSLDYLSQFARLMRMILENSQKKYIPIKTELDALELYLNLEILRYEQKINFEINIAKDINTLEYKIPPLLLQPYCENAIKHGLANKKDGGKIKISMYRDIGKIKCSIEDNGVGRVKANLISQNEISIKQHKSLGTEISANRVKILNELYSDDIKINVIDLNDDEGMPTGTCIEIVLPIIANHEL